MDLAPILERKEQILTARANLVEQVEVTRRNIVQAQAQIEQWTATINAQAGALDSIEFMLALAQAESEAKPGKKNGKAAIHAVESLAPVTHATEPEKATTAEE